MLDIYLIKFHNALFEVDLLLWVDDLDTKVVEVVEMKYKFEVDDVKLNELVEKQKHFVGGFVEEFDLVGELVADLVYP